MTPYTEVYDAFLSKVNDDTWDSIGEMEIAEQDWRAILESAIPYFKFPNVSLDRDGNGFKETLTSEEIQILATLMKIEWLNRNIETWENTRPLYDERDFSPANLIDKLVKLLNAEMDKVKRLQKIYYRAVHDKNGLRRPYDYTKWGGK